MTYHEFKAGQLVIITTGENRDKHVGIVMRAWGRPQTDPYVTVRVPRLGTFVRCSSRVEVVTDTRTEQEFLTSETSTNAERKLS